MPKLILNLDEKEDMEVDIYKARKRLKSKEKAIKDIIRSFLKIR